MRNSQYNTRPPTSQPLRPKSVVGADKEPVNARDYEPPPSFPNMAMKSSVADDQRSSNPAPTHTAMARDAVSTFTNGNNRVATAGDRVQLPTRVDLFPRNNSDYTGKGVATNNVAQPNARAKDSTATATPSVKQLDDVVISVVGKKFREVNPTAYYMEKKIRN